MHVKGGLFSTRLGENAALPAIFDGRALWLGITVGGDPQAAPRLPVSFVAYALYANRAGTAGARIWPPTRISWAGSPPRAIAMPDCSTRVRWPTTVSMPMAT